MKRRFHFLTSVTTVLFFLAAILVSQEASSKIVLPRLISDGIVLQRNKEINIWGWANAGEKITLNFLGKMYTATTSADKKWKIVLAAQKAGGPYEMQIQGENSIIIKNILIGDVWLCSGQSNMAYQMQRCKERFPNEIASSDNPFIRQFLVKPSFSFQPKEDCVSDGWIAASPSSVLDFTAVGYFFARELYDRYKIPIGIINSSIGGTPAEAWISEEGLQFMPDYLQAYHYYQDPEHVKQAQLLNKRTQDSLKSNMNRTLPVKFNHQPVSLYNSMIEPLVQYSIKGVLWYQGEANVSDPYTYRKLMPALIKDWRSKFDDAQLPFLYVQLANYGKQSSQPSESNLSLLREAQAMALSLPNTAMAVIHDAGEINGNIHPSDKKTVGYRLSLLARHLVYGEKNLIASGPVFTSMKADGNKMVLSFTNVGGGLTTNDGKAPSYFAIAGADKKFVWAQAKIEGNKIIVWNDEIKKPVAVRYAWAANPIGANVYNKEGLPLASFRTDQWDNKITKDDADAAGE